MIARLRESGIGCQVYFPPIHEQPYLQDSWKAQAHFFRTRERFLKAA